MIDLPLHHRLAHPDQWNAYSGSATDTLIEVTTQTGALGVALELDSVSRRHKGTDSRTLGEPPRP